MFTKLVGTDVEMSEVKSEGQDPETEEDQLEKATQNVRVNVCGFQEHFHIYPLWIVLVWLWQCLCYHFNHY